MVYNVNIIEKTKNKSIINLSLVLIISFIIWSLPDILRIESLTILWFMTPILISLYFIIYYRSLIVFDVVMSLIFGSISMINNTILGITCIFAYMGAQSVFRKTKNKVVLLKGTDPINIATTILLAIFIGSLLGMINSFLPNGVNTHLSFRIDLFFRALRSGITEEIIFRFFLFAICIHVISDKTLSFLENILCYLIMTIPLVLLHLTLASFSISNFLILWSIFGIPYAIFQRKQDLASAIAGHFLIDFIRYCLYSA